MTHETPFPDFRADGMVGPHSPGTRIKEANAPSAARSSTVRSYAFCANDLDKFGIPFFLPVATMLLALGSSATAIVQGLIQLIRHEIGRLPAHLHYLLIDAIPPQAHVDPTQYLQIGTDGAGTEAAQGWKLFRQHAESIRNSLSRRLDHLFQDVDPTYPLLFGPSQEIAFWIVAGCGGTSGGALQPAITLCHDLAREHDVKEPKVNVVMLGAEMAIDDRTRVVSQEQKSQIQANCTTNLVKLARDMETPGTIEETRPHDGSTFSVKASQRVHSLVLLDKSNGFTHFASTEEMSAMAVHALYARIFTEGGQYVAQRWIDLRRTGATGLPNDS